MNKTSIKNFAVEARREFRRLVRAKLESLGITEADVLPATVSGDFLLVNDVPFPKEIREQRNSLILEVGKRGYEQLVDAAAYTWFNRFCALRFMEVHEYIPYRVLSSSTGQTVPDIITHAVEAVQELGCNNSVKSAVRELKLHGGKDNELYRLLVISQCNALSQSLPFMFEQQSDFSELLLPDNLLQTDSIVQKLARDIDEADWQDIEIIGWLYQYYISEKKDEVIGNVKSKEDIPAATQLFTPEWIVRYMVQNSLGRLWLEIEPHSDLADSMEYYIDNSIANPDYLPPEHEHIKTPEDIKLIDNACGSGHILVYAFDLLFEIYRKHGYADRDISALILQNNLYGIDIDERAAQLANFALTMKARAHDRRFLEKNIPANIIEIVESDNIDMEHVFDTNDKPVSPFSAPDDLLEDEELLTASASPVSADIATLRQQLKTLIKLFIGAKNYGSLLKVPDWLTERLPEINETLDKLEHDGIYASSAIRQLQTLAKQAGILARKYDVCVANPPYMGTFYKELKDFAIDEYPDSKSDLFAMFIERGFDMVNDQCFNTMVTMQSWMFLSSYENLRIKLLNNFTIECMVHMANMVMGIAFGTAATVWRKKFILDYKGAFCFVEYEDIGPENKPITFPPDNERNKSAIKAGK